MLLSFLPFTNSVSAQVVVFEDSFEDGNTNGWIMGGVEDTASAGTWVIGDPEGTFLDGVPIQPEDAYEGVGCAFTAHNPDPPNEIGFHDVDDGVVFLVSPVMDLSSYSSVRLEYVRWYYLRDLNVEAGDYFVVQARESESTAWVDLEFLDNSAPANAWTQRSYFLEDFLSLTPTVQIRFGASDRFFPPILGNILEAAIDQVRVTGLTGCGSEGQCNSGEYCSSWGGCQPFGDGDVDEDGDTDLADYSECIACVGVDSESCAVCNLMGDAPVSVEDAAEFGQRMSGPE